MSIDRLKVLPRTLLNLVARIIRWVIYGRPADGCLGQVQKIAVVRECCIGDVLQTTPALRALKAAFPKAEIHYYTGHWSKPAILGNPAVDKVIEIPDYNPNTGIPLRQVLFFWSKRKERYDIILCFNYGFFHGLESLLMGSRIRVGFDDERGMGCFFNVRIPYLTEGNRQSLYADMVGTIAPVDAMNMRMEFYFDERDIEKVSSLLGTPKVDGPLVAISPGGAVNPFAKVFHRRWFPERFAAVADILRKKHGARIVLIGGRSDSQVAAEVALRISTPCINLVGSTSLHETGALLSICSLLISNDSAPVFLASAVGCPTVVIYGPELSRVASPLGYSHISLEADLPCRPCFPKPSCSEPECMGRISVDMVVQAAEQLLLRKT